MSPPLRRSLRTRAIRALALGATAFGLFAGAASAQSSAPSSGTWPTKPIRLVSPFNPGGAIDVLNRVIAEKLGQRLGQQVFVDAVPGAVSSTLPSETWVIGVKSLTGSNGSLRNRTVLFTCVDIVVIMKV